MHGGPRQGHRARVALPLQCHSYLCGLLVCQCLDFLSRLCPGVPVRVSKADPARASLLEVRVAALLHKYSFGLQSQSQLRACEPCEPSPADTAGRLLALCGAVSFLPPLQGHPLSPDSPLVTPSNWQVSFFCLLCVS